MSQGAEERSVMSERSVFVKDLSQTRVVTVKVRAVKLKGTDICRESIKIDLSDVTRAKHRVPHRLVS